MNLKIIIVHPKTALHAEVTKDLIDQVSSLTNQISILYYQIQYGNLSKAQKTTQKKLKKAYEKEKLATLNLLSIPQMTYELPKTPKVLKYFSELHPEISKKKTQKNTQKNI